EGPATFAQTSALLVESRPGLQKATKTLKTLGSATAPVLKLLDTINPVLPNLDATLTDATPLVQTLGAHGCDIKAFGHNWSSAQLYGNDLGNFLRFNVISAGAESIYGIDPAVVKASAPYASAAYPKPCAAGTTDKIPAKVSIPVSLGGGNG